MPFLTPGRFLFIVANLAVSAGAFIADFNTTHVYNPKWPPHARFHNGQTMSLGVCLGSLSLYFAFLPSLANSANSRLKTTLSAEESLFYAAVVGTLYWLAGMSAILYPGTDWFDPGDTEGGLQKGLFPSMIAAVWVGYWLEVRRYGGKVKGT